MESLGADQKKETSTDRRCFAQLEAQCCPRLSARRQLMHIQQQKEVFNIIVV
jgi:hypothetical protein